MLHRQARPTFDLPVVEFFQQTFRFLSLADRRLAVVTLFMLLSLAGVPPALGFVAKFYLFFLLYQAHSYFLLALVFFFNLISLAYYLRLLRYIFFKNSASRQALEEVQ